MKQRKDGLGKRRRAREMALQMLYQRELGGSTSQEILAAFDVVEYVRETEIAAADNGDGGKGDGGKDDDGKGDGGKVRAGKDDGGKAEAAAPEIERERAEESFDYARRLLTGVEEHAEAIDEQIRRHAENWRLERMPVIDRNILRLAIYEMLHESSVPKVVIVDEAIELAKKFGSENSGRFVNGLLDGVLKAADDSPAPEPARSATGKAP